MGARRLRPVHGDGRGSQATNRARPARLTSANQGSSFSAVDTSPDPAALVAYLDRGAVGLAAMKRYMATTVVRVAPGGVVLDIGCGAGHDLELLAGNGFRPIGLDPSAVMLTETASRLPGVPLLRAAGESLPLRDGSIDGCRMERVLMHVDDPSVVLDEVARVVRAGGFVAAFEPDWSGFTIDGDEDAVGSRLSLARSADVGGRLEALVEASGFRILDVVTEDSRGYALDRVPTDVERHARRILGDDAAEVWLADQRAREAAGTFRARWIKTLVVAQRR